MKLHLLILAVAIVISLPLPTTNASVSYRYTAEFQDFGPNYGTNNILNLYLEEVSTAGSFQAANDGGLYSAGVALVEQPGTVGVTFTAAGVSNNSAAEPNGFSGNNTKGLVTSGGAWLGDITGNSATVGVTPVSSRTDATGTTTSLYLLGSVTIGLSANPSGTFLIESMHDAPANDGVTDAGSDFNTLTYNTLYDLDQTGANGAPGATGADGHPTFFYFGPVPEPTSIGVFGVAAVGLLKRQPRVEHLGRKVRPRAV